MPPSTAGADAVLTASAGPIRLDESLLRLARLGAEAGPEAVLREVVATLRLAGASLWEVDPEHGIPGRVASIGGNGSDGPGTAAPAGDGDLPAVMRLFETRVDLHPGAPSRDGGSPPLHVADAGIWRGGSLTGCLRCERTSTPLDERETAYVAAVAERVARLAEERERRGAQERLREREMKLDEVEQLTRLGSWEWDVANDVITWSPEQLRLHGADPSLRSQSFAEFLDRVHPADRRCVVEECGATLATGIPFSFPYRIVREDGTEREMEALGKLLPGTGGANARLVGVSRDVTELMQAERALRASEESYRAIFENVSDGIWVHDPETGELLDINPAAGSMFGYTKEEMLAAGHDALLYPGSEYTAERVAEYMARTAAGETPRFEWLGRHRDGGEVWGEVTMRRVTIGGAERILASVRDIAERKAAERALQRVNEQLEIRVAERTAELAASNEALAVEVAEHQAAREELTARTQQLEAVFAALPDLYFRLDRDGTVLDHRAGPGAASYLLPAELVGRRLPDLFPEAIGARFAAAIEEVDRAGELVCVEYDLGDESGTRSFEARILRCDDGSLVTIVRDITDRKASEEALRRSEEHFRALIENGSDYIMIVDATASVRYVGPSVRRILGYEPEEMIGLRPEDIVHPADISRVRAALQDIVAHPGRVVAIEYRVRHRDGSWRLFENYGRTLRDDSAEAGVVANGRDITDRRRAEDEIARQKAYFEEILESLDAGISVFDREGRFEYTSASAITDPQIRRWVIGKTIEDYGRARGLPESVVAERRRSLDEAIATRTPNQFEEEAIGRDGTPRQMLRRLIPLVDEAGEVVRMVGYSVDITDRKRVEVALQQAKEEAERANRAKSEFLSRMSHELRTPLNGILGFAQVLERRDPRPDQQAYVGHILKGGRHLLRLINEVLELSRIEAGRMSLSLEAIALDEAVREAMDLVRPLAEQGGHELELCSTAGPGAFVYADRQRLVQVLLNLLSNAIKYNRRAGRVRISCERRRDEAINGYSVLVEDQGRGIPHEGLDQLFTPFARLGAEQTDTEGTGLGLALSKRLAEAMAGNLALESTGPEGSTFRLDLRCTSNPLASGAENEGAASVATAGEGAAATILYIEDNVTNLTLVETLFESRPQWTTVAALRGEEGVELALSRTPDLILLDLHLPDIPGEEVLRRLRSDRRTAEIPVIVISADATGAAMNRLRAAGADDYLTKPLDLDQFLGTVDRYLPG